MDYRKLQHALEGVPVTHVTPFGDDLAVDVEGLRRHVRFLVDYGVKVLVTNGNTGEFYALTLDECRHVLEVVVDEVGGEATIVAGVGHDAATAVALSQHAQATGAQAVMVHNPVHPYQTAAGIQDYYDRIAGAVQIGVVPYVRTPLIDTSVLAHIAKRPNVVGCKYAINDLQAFAQVVREIPADESGMAWVCGTAESWAPFFFVAGAKGFTSGLANVAPALALEMHEALSSGDTSTAMRLWELVKPFEAMRSRQQSGLNVSVVKAALELAGMPAGPVRPPITPLGVEEIEELRAILGSWGQAVPGDAA